MLTTQRVSDIQQMATAVDVGATSDPNSRKVRIVHISDTNMKHDDMLASIPPGDILVHSGNFSKYHWTRHFKFKEYVKVLRAADEFFSKLPHKYKIFVAGNQELHFEKETLQDLQDYMPHAIYLQDSSVCLMGIKFYGSPWTMKQNGSHASGHTTTWEHLRERWERIPMDTDVLVTHMPPYNILDLGHKKHKSTGSVCPGCGRRHDDSVHGGCRNLREIVLNKVRPTLHLFGHVHEQNHVTRVDDITFSNAAMKSRPNPHEFKYFVTKPQKENKFDSLKVVKSQLRQPKSERVRHAKSWVAETEYSHDSVKAFKTLSSRGKLPSFDEPREERRRTIHAEDSPSDVGVMDINQYVPRSYGSSGSSLSMPYDPEAYSDPVVV